MTALLDKKSKTIIVNGILHKYCKGCKTIKPKTEFSYSKTTKNKIQSKCKQCNSDYHIKNKEKINKDHRERSLGSKNKYVRLVSSSKRRNIEVSLTYEEYIKIIDNICYYCPNPLPLVGIGLDRIDSAKGYSADNCRPCCTVCNAMKNTLTEEQFYDHITKILKKSNRVL